TMTKPPDQEARPSLQNAPTVPKRRRSSIRKAPADLGKRSLVVVLGVHRSGTSPMTRDLEAALGIDVGDNLMKPVEGNRLTEGLLSRPESSWHGLAALAGGESQAAQDNAHNAELDARLRLAVGRVIGRKATSIQDTLEALHASAETAREQADAETT